MAGDVVFVRESISVKSQLSPTVYRCHMGQRTEMTLPPGYGGLIGMMQVMGKHRSIAPTDVVYDYGDVSEWSIIECRDFEPLRLALPDLMIAIGKSRASNPRFLDLWRIRDEYVRPLLMKLGRDR
jgi:hypothetical protein